MAAAIQGAARSRTHPPNRSANEHANTGWSGKATSRSVSPSLKDWSWTGLSMTQASFFSAATSPGSTLSPSRCSCAKHFEVADRASSGTGVAGGAVCFDAAGGAVAFWSMSTGRRGGSGTAAAEAHPAAEERHVEKRQVATGRVTVRTTTEVSEEVARATLEGESVEVTRVPVNREIDAASSIRTDGDVTIIPVVEE